MTALNRQTGRAMDPNSLDHLIQSIGDILTTPRGGRVMRRDYGSELPDLVDQPLNRATRLRIYAATAMALLRWEPRVRLRRVRLEQAGQGGCRLLLDVSRTDLPTRPSATFAIPI